jgi:hypothetical protein
MVESDKLDRSARYTAPGFSGCALFIRGFPKRWEPYTTLVECRDEDCDCHENEDKLHEEDTGEGEWVEQDESCGRVIVTMVGDDGKHEIDIEDLTKIDDLDYCAVCGQIGCGHDGRERD